MKMGRGVCAHLRSFFLFLYQSGAVPVATKGATLLEIVRIRGTGMHYAYISRTTLPFPSPIVIYLFLKTCVCKLLHDACGSPINKKTFSGVFSTLPRVTSKKFRPVKKETGMSSYLDTGLVNIRHVAKGNRGSRAYTHVRRDAIVSGPGLRQNSLTELGLRLIVSGERERRRGGGGGSVERRKRGQIQGKGQKG